MVESRAFEMFYEDCESCDSSFKALQEKSQNLLHNKPFPNIYLTYQEPKTLCMCLTTLV